MNIARYSKSLSALVVGALGWGAQVIASPSAAITAPEWLGLGTALAVVLGVFTVVNTPAPAVAPAPAPKVVVPASAL